MSSLQWVLLTDAVLLSLCTSALVLHGRLSALHPATTYIFFHAYTVTLRLLAIEFGASLMRTLPEPATLEEVLRAARAFDLALIAVTVLWLHLASQDRRLAGRAAYAGSRTGAQTLSPKLVQVIAIVSIIVGVIALRYLQFSGADTRAANLERLGEWNRSGWVTMTMDWALQGTMMLHYLRGFPPVHTAITVGLFVLAALSTSRYSVVVWGIFACFIALSRKRRRWPSVSMILVLGAIAVVWFPLKIIRASYWAGEGVEGILRSAVTYVTAEFAPGGNGDDTDFLDQAALVITLVDQRGSYFHGSTLAPLLVMPVPRPWWPAKPIQNQWEKDISTPARPIGAMGFTATMVGEGYANFGWVGVVVYPLLAAYGYGKLYFLAIRRPYNSVLKFAYLFVASMLIQVFRDGLVSAVTFTLVAAMPMTFVLYLHWLFLPKLKQRRFAAVDLSRTAA
jgi:hypothetical protein